MLDRLFTVIHAAALIGVAIIKFYKYGCNEHLLFSRDKWMNDGKYEEKNRMVDRGVSLAVSDHQIVLVVEG